MDRKPNYYFALFFENRRKIFGRLKMNKKLAEFMVLSVDKFAKEKHISC
jgi:hypothetical protein